MKSPALNRILEKSPSESLAALSVCAFLRADTSEIDRIYGAIPSHGKGSRNEFFIQHHAMAESVLLWAVEYWKTVATVRTCVAATLAPGVTDKDANISTFLQRAHEAKLATLIEAMRSICVDTGINFDDVAAFAEVETDIDANPIPKLIPEYVAMFGVTG